MTTTDAHGQEWIVGPGAPEPLDSKPKRGPRPSPNPRTRLIMVRLTPVDLMLVTKAAQDLGKPVATWAREVMLREIKRNSSIAIGS